jgi:hypothetical protein
MANEKTYPNYLMHYRTKGSKNGVSRTKGYDAVGQKAKGQYINGRYVYGTPKSYGANVENTQSESVSKPSSLHISPRGHYVNGHYVYYEDEAKQRAFRQGLAEARGRNSAYKNQAMVKRMENARKADVLDQKMYGKKIKGYTRLADISPYEKQRLANKYLSNSPQHQTAVNQHNAEVAGKEAALTYAQKKRKQTNIGASQAADAARMNAETRNRILSSSKSSLEKGASNDWQQQANAAASGKPSGYNNAHYSAVSQAAAERKAKEAALERQKKASKGTSFSTSRDASGNVRVTHKLKTDHTANNWQQTANKTAGILGNMSREDRSLMKSREWVSRDKNGKKQVNNGFNVNNKYGYSNYTKDDKGWHDVHMGEYNTAGVKGVKKQQDWNTSFERNHRSDIGNAIADAKEDAKKAFKEAKADAKQTYVNLKSKLKSKFKKKKK